MFGKDQLLKPFDINDNSRISFVSVICSLNLIFTLFGYQLVLAALTPIIPIEVMENSNITWYVRAYIFALVPLAALFGRAQNGRLDLPMKMFIFFCILYLIRLFLDTAVIPVSSHDYITAWRLFDSTPSYIFLQAWMLTIVSILCPLISIYLSWEKINFERSLEFLIISLSFSCAMSLYSLVQEGGVLIGVDATDRIEANSRLGSIVFGHMGTSLALLSVFKYFSSSRFSIWKAISILSTLIGLLVALRSGSRGPVVAFIFVMVFWIASILKSMPLFITISSILSVIIFLARDKLVEWVAVISPILAQRMELTTKYGEGRDFHLDFYIETFGKGVGTQIDFLGYSHNVFIDGIMMFGIFFWIIPAILLPALFRSYKMLSEKSNVGWVALLYLQAFLGVQFSGMIGGNGALQGSLFLIFLFFMKFRSEANRKLMQS